MEKLTELYNELLNMGVDVFSGSYHLSGSCDSTVIQINDWFGVFLDIERIRAPIQELEAVAHEWAHITTGATYTVGATNAVIQRAEMRATRAQIKKLLPFDEMRAAMEAGYTERYELAEYFEVPEDLIQQAVDYYTGPCGLSFMECDPLS